MKNHKVLFVAFGIAACSSQAMDIVGNMLRDTGTAIQDAGLAVSEAGDDIAETGTAVAQQAQCQQSRTQIATYTSAGLSGSTTRFDIYTASLEVPGLDPTMVAYEAVMCVPADYNNCPASTASITYACTGQQPRCQVVPVMQTEGRVSVDCGSVTTSNVNGMTTITNSFSGGATSPSQLRVFFRRL